MKCEFSAFQVQVFWVVMLCSVVGYLWNSGNLPQHYTVSQPRRPELGNHHSFPVQVKTLILLYFTVWIFQDLYISFRGDGTVFLPSCANSWSCDFVCTGTKQLQILFIYAAIIKAYYKCVSSDRVREKILLWWI